MFNKLGLSDLIFLFFLTNDEFLVIFINIMIISLISHKIMSNLVSLTLIIFSIKSFSILQLPKDISKVQKSKVLFPK